MATEERYGTVRSFVGGEKASFFGDLHAQADDAIRFYTDQTAYIERWPDE